MQSMRDFKHIWHILSNKTGGGDPKNNLDLGGIRKIIGNFQIFTHAPPLINDERSLSRYISDSRTVVESFIL